MTVPMTAKLLGAIPVEVAQKAMDFIENLVNESTDPTSTQGEQAFHTLLDYAIIGVIVDAGGVVVEGLEE